MADPRFKDYLERWRAVEEIERQELRRTTIQERWIQTNAILNLAKALGLPVETDDQEELAIHKRWARLKSIQ